MARILKTPQALADAAEIWAYIAADNRDAAGRLLNQFDKTLALIADSPTLGTKRDELAPNL